ncbi:6-carboxy-5,6,7,8-tetrahydropterin synthase [Pseudomonas phage sp. 30-2]|nr:QueD-like 6-pyruvoyl-tetrahydropterin synthase [Pseudomonas phage Deifobo]BDR25793.1 6-carboxy-5,6,7,8-tetrahydropterin synthase [Pseudomonas phage sp. 30-2]
MWQINKSFSFAYAHRVHNQHLDADLVEDTKCKCRHLHGHTGKIVIHLTGTSLVNGMVTDFKHLGFLKKFIDDVIDHKFIIDANDPNFSKITNASKYSTISFEHYGIFDTSEETVEHEKEHADSFVIVDFVPTAENLAKWIWEYAESILEQKGITVSKVEWWETDKACATYIA